VCLVDEERGVVERAVTGVDVAVVGDVVAAVREWRGVPGTHPHGIDAEGREVAERVGHAQQVPRTITVPVLERPRIDLVDHRMPPPVDVGEVRRRHMSHI